MSHAITFETENAFREKIGATGLSQSRFSQHLANTKSSILRLKQEIEGGKIPHFRLPFSSADLPEITTTAETLKQGATDIVMYGTGGSSLGGQTVAQLGGWNTPTFSVANNPRLHFFDNLDPLTLERALNELPLATTKFVMVSKSGGTAETLMQTIATLSALKSKGLPTHNLVGITEPAGEKRNALRDILSSAGAKILNHDPELGGRYCVFSAVGLLPAALIGLDIKALRAGATDALTTITAHSDPLDCPAAVGAALAATAAEEGKNISVMMPYADKLERLAHWWVQLWSESLGKQGKGTTPLACLGPVDQHSQVQLFLGGPKDKLFTVISTAPRNQGNKLDAGLCQSAGEPDFANRTVGDLVAAQARATADTLARNGCPTRLLTVETLDERALGYLLMHYMLETMITADLWAVNPFDQPAVEEGKILAKKYLKG